MSTTIAITNRRKARLKDFVGSVTLVGDGKSILLPTSAEDNKRQAQVEAAKLGAFINDWMKSNRNNIEELKPQQLKDLAMAIKTKQEIAEKAYGKSDAPEGKGNSDDVAAQAAKAIQWMLENANKDEQKKGAIEIEAEDVDGDL